MASDLSTILNLTATAYGTTLTAEISIGDQTFNLLPDTGSADLWVLTPGWECYSGHHTNSSVLVTQRECEYGNRTYVESPTFEPKDDAWLGAHYGAGDVFGTLGFDTVQIGDIALPRQQFGLVNSTNGPADRYSEGIMGLGHQVLSQTHSLNFTGTSALELLSNTLWYEGTLLSLSKTDMEPFFAVALERVPLDQEISFGGYLSFGTLPPVDYSQDWVTTPVEITTTIPASFTNGTQKITEWTATVESVTWDGQMWDTPWQAVVDTGNFYFIVPEKLAMKINSAFDPPSVYQPDGPLGPVWSVQCNATPPADVGFQLGGKMFSVDGADMIYRDWDGNCFSTVATAGSLGGIELFFLGDYFLRNVVAVFDFGANEMRWTERIRNETDAEPAPGYNASEAPSEPEQQVANGASSTHRHWLVSVTVGVLLSAAFM